jgi:hypothetical protein
MMAGTREVQYLVLPDLTHPYLLARVRWPDVFQAISPVRPDWQDDIGLFDLPYDPSSTTVTLEQAAAIAAEWGARLPADESDRTSEPALMRRMPADWSNLSRAEKRAFAIEFVKTRKPAAAGEERAHDPVVATSGSRHGRWPWRRRVVAPSLEPSEVVLEEDVIDLTDTREDEMATVEDA